MTVHAFCGETVLKDHEVIEAAAPAGTIESLVALHAAMVFRIAYSILRNHHDAEDAVQECFLRVVKYESKMADVANLKTWLARIAWTTALDRRRTLRRMPQAQTQIQINDTRDIFSLPDPAVDLDDQLVADEMRLLLQKLIASLPRDLREIVELSTVHEFTSAEIAEIIQIPEASVRTRLFRARRMLKEKLAAQEVRRNG